MRLNIGAKTLFERFYFPYAGLFPFPSRDNTAEDKPASRSTLRTLRRWLKGVAINKGHVFRRIDSLRECLIAGCGNQLVGKSSRIKTSGGFSRLGSRDGVEQSNADR